MPKLHLKRTPQEEAARQLRKQKRRHSAQGDTAAASTTSRKRRRSFGTAGLRETPRQWASSDEEPEASTIPSFQENHPRSPANSYRVDHDEEERFREKMVDALQDDEYLDSLEARLSSFAHVPGRWRYNGPKPDGHGTEDILHLDPQDMDDEEYVEWVRLGMYRRTHAKEHAEYERKQTLEANRRAEEKARRAETKRLGRASEEHRKRKRLDREIRRKEVARMEYDHRWKELSRKDGDFGLNDRESELKFSNIPWPILATYPSEYGSSAGLCPVTLEDLTAKGISDFLFGASPEKRQRKEILKETLLRFHPDKFEGRFMQRINQDERDAVKEAIGQVVRALNLLMDDDG